MQPAMFPVGVQAGVTCPWCKHYWPTVPQGAECANCGGALPAPPGPTRGNPPPQAPRHLPEKYVRDLFLWNNTVAMVGTIFAAFGGLFGGLGVFLCVVLLPLGLAFMAFGMLFGGIGLFMRKKSREGAEKQVAALTTGLCAEGQIVSVNQNLYETINGRHPFQIDYVFQVNGQWLSGSAKAWDILHGMRQPREPLWVVYLPSDPTVSSIWPPVR